MSSRQMVMHFCAVLVLIAVPSISGFDGLFGGSLNLKSKITAFGIAEIEFTAFLDYKATFERSYSNEADEIAALLAFVQNLKLINTQNEKYKRGESRFEEGVNNFTDISNSIFVSTHTGYVAKAKARSLREFEYPITDLPPYLNYVEQGLVTKPMYQGYCGACWAFTTTGAVEAQFAKKTGQLTKLSEQNLIDCNKHRDYGNWGCQGGNMQIAFNYIRSNGGIDSYSSYPYRGRGNNPCKYDPSKSVGTIEDFIELQSGNETELMLALVNIGPIALAIDASVPTFQNYKSGIYDDSKCLTEPNHAVLLVGYGVENDAPYWILKNSWGSNWGERGFFRMLRSGNFCGILEDPSYPKV